MEELFQAFIDAETHKSPYILKERAESCIRQITEASTSKRLSLIPDIDVLFVETFTFLDSINEHNDFMMSFKKSLRDVSSTSTVDYFSYRLPFCKTGDKNE